MNMIRRTSFLQRRRPCAIERLERRQLLSVTVASFDVGAGSITFGGDNAGQVQDELRLWQLGGFLAHNATVGDYASAIDIDPGPGVAQLEVASASLIEVNAGDGADVVDASGITAGSVRIIGGAGNDRLIGSDTPSPLGDHLEGGLGDDTLIGLSGDDDLFGNEGNDILQGGNGNDILTGGDGDDTLDLGTGLDEVDGGGGVNQLNFTGGAGEMSISALGANVVVFAAGDGSSTGLFGAANVQTVSVIATGTGPSQYEVSDLSGTVVERLGIQLIDGLGSGSELRIQGTSNSDHLVVTDATAFGMLRATAQTGWGQVAFRGTPGSTLVVDGLGGDDELEIPLATAFGGTAVSLVGGAGNETIRIGAGNLNDVREPLTVDGGDGTDALFVDDAGQSLAVDYRITPSALTSTNAANASSGQPARTFGGLSYTSATESLRIDGSQAPNIFDVLPSGTTEYTVNGNAPLPRSVAAVTGDFLRLDTTGTSGRRLEIPVPKSGNGRWTFTSGEEPVNFESIERFNHVERLAIAAEAGRFSQPIVKVYDAETMEFLFQFMAYEPSYRGGVHVATGDIDQDGIPDIVTAPGRIHAPVIKVYDGNGTGGELAEFLAYGNDFQGGVNIAVGDVTGDHVNDIVTAPGRGVSEIRMFQNQNLGQSFGLATTFLAFASNFIGGATVAVADVNGDGTGDVVVGSGSGMTATVKVFNGMSLGALPAATMNPFSADQRGGVNVSAANVISGSEPIVVAASGPASSAGLSVMKKIPSGVTSKPFQLVTTQALTLSAEMHENLRSPLRASAVDFDLDGIVDTIFASQGSDGKSRRLRLFRNSSFAAIDSVLETADWLHNGFYLG